jgi:hypothetical protein
MSQLLEYLPVRYFWHFNGMSSEHFMKLVEYLHVEAGDERVPSAIKRAREFGRIFGLVEDKRKHQSPPLRQKFSGLATELYPVPYDPDASFRIIGIAPSGDQVDEYNRGLRGCFDEKGNVKARLPHAHHNVISSALLVIHGSTRVVLGGDVERNGWSDAIEEIGPKHLAAHAVKISHHGSSNGYCEGLWTCFAASGKPVTVVTAYVSQSLPRQSALNHIIEHADRVLTTCITALKPDQLPTELHPGAVKSRLALLTKMRLLGDENRHQCGRCSLTFDDQGQCVDQELVPPAAIILAHQDVPSGSGYQPSPGEAAI